MYEQSGIRKSAGWVDGNDLIQENAYGIQNSGHNDEIRY